MSHFKQQILKDVEIAIKSNINNNTKNESVSRICVQENFHEKLFHVCRGTLILS